MIPTNCHNCGAPLHGYKCEYCGTEYSADVAYDNKVIVNIKGLAYPTVEELCRAITEKMQYQQR